MARHCGISTHLAKKGFIVEICKVNKKKRKLPFYALKLQAWPQTNLHTYGFHIAMKTHNCSISSKSGIHPLGYAPSISSYKLLPFIPIIQSCTESIHLFHSRLTKTNHKLSYIHTFSILSIWLNQWRTLSSTPFPTLHNSLIHAFGILSIC